MKQLEHALRRIEAAIRAEAIKQVEAEGLRYQDVASRFNMSDLRIEFSVDIHAPSEWGFEDE